MIETRLGPDPRVVYVVGCTHSGSTLLARILDQHPRIFSAGELQYLDRCWGPTGRPCGCGEPLVRCAVWGEVWRRLSETELDLVSFSRVSSERLLEWFRATTGWYDRRGKNPFGPANRLLFQAIAATTGAEVVVDNSKDLWRLLPLRHALGDRLRILHLVRAPDAMVASYLARKERGFGRAAFGKYLRVNLLARALFGRDAGYRSLRYEELVADPERVVGDLVAWLGLEPVDPFAGERRPAHDVNPNRDTQRTVASTLRPDPTLARARSAFTGVRGLVIRVLRRLCYDPA